MSLFKCKMCGGALEVSGGESVAVCEYCGTKQTLPKLDDERKANLYDRANHFRRGNDFDKAAAIYEQILDVDTEDAEAYWSLVLCRYGIEYVEDPASHKRLPTVNRAQFTSIFADEDYKSAIKYADGYQREIYEQEAKAIDEIQRGILAISEKEEPFDVFICYKETDANGRRTPDSVLANDLYHELTKEGFKVFFSRITLEDKLGTAYEPYIFAALNSAKVMVVVGTKAEYFNAVWVKNEWSRYLALIKNGAKKTLIPAYRDMDPYDLPDEFSHLQAQDMSKLGFMQDLIRGIKKIVQAGEPKATVVKETVVSAGSANVAPLLRRAFMFLEDKDWKSANDYCEKVLDLEPENAEAYLGKLLAQLRVDREENLKNSEFTFDQIGNYEKIMRFGSEELKARLEGYNRFIIERNEAEELEEKYSEAVAAMKKAYKKPDYIAASEMFKEISDYKDSAELYEKCLAEAEVAEKRDIYLTALELMNQGLKANNIDKLEEAIGCFESVKGYESADEYIIQCRKSIETIKNNLKERALAEMREREAAHRKNIITTVLAIIFLVVVVFLVVLFTVILPKIRYNKAVEAYLTGSYSEAMEATIVISRSGYSDASVEALRQTVQVYFDAVELYNSGDYTEACKQFVKLQDYRDVKSKYMESAYQIAVELRDNKDYDSANPIFEALDNYKDSKELIHYHDYKVQHTNKVTCTEDGLDTYTCNCGDTYTEIVKSTGHTYTEKRTCTEGIYCTKCKYERNPPLGHTTETGACERCGYNFTKPLVFKGTSHYNGKSETSRQKYDLSSLPIPPDYSRDYWYTVTVKVETKTESNDLYGWSVSLHPGGRFENGHTISDKYGKSRTFKERFYFSHYDADYNRYLEFSTFDKGKVYSYEITVAPDNTGIKR